MSKTLLRLLRWSAIFAFCEASSKTVVSKSVFYLNVIMDSILAGRLKQEGRTPGDHMKELINRVNKLLGQLVPPGSINLTKLVVNSATEDSQYFELWNDGRVKSEKTLRSFIRFINMYTQYWDADFVLLITGRSMTKDNDPTQSVEGIKWGKGVCGSMTAALVSDTGDDYRTALTITHELSHALGAHHDGEDTTMSCKNIGKSIMSSSVSGIGATYSMCSIKDIYTFLKSDQATCLFEKPSRGPAVDPEVENRRKRKCEELKKEDEYYYVRKGCNFCKYSCLFVSSTRHSATRETWLREEDGTPCNASHPEQKCKGGYCLQEEIPISEDIVEKLGF
uniref:Reprolysin n=1 Tax=Rhipicephalus appendiculatus TaxID=34631 RepID=A0A131YDY8_RHIAP